MAGIRQVGGRAGEHIGKQAGGRQVGGRVGGQHQAGRWAGLNGKKAAGHGCFAAVARDYPEILCGYMDRHMRAKPGKYFY